MAFENPVLNISRVAAQDFTNLQFRAVKLNGEGQIVLAGVGEPALGILQDNPANGQVGAVMVLGVSKAVFGASVTAGQLLQVGTNGTLVPVTTGTPVAIALESGATGEVRTVLVR